MMGAARPGGRARPNPLHPMSNPDSEEHRSRDLPPGVVLREHVYDGIEEYDQRLPNWWLWTFYLSIIFAFLSWFGWYTSQAFASDEERLAAEMDTIEARRFAMAGTIDNDSLWAMSRNTTITASNMEVYRAQCVFCHGEDLSGGLGGGLPLNDEEWRWGHEPVDIYSVVKEGSPDPTKGMQAWERELGPTRVSAVVAYILSFHEPERMQLAPDSPGRASLR